jgi:hypothetical protein
MWSCAPAEAEVYAVGSGAGGGFSGAADEELNEKSSGDGLQCLYAL